MKFARYMITDWNLTGVATASPAPEFIQLRDKELEGGALLRVTLDLMRLRRGETKIIVNGRLDVALAAGADGVHLPAGSPGADPLRRICPNGFLIGVSCHTVDEVRQAHQDGADYCLFGPVFTPISKHDTREPRGMAGLSEAVAAAPIPVFALGGIKEEHVKACAAAGAAGIAGISIFFNSQRTTLGRIL